MVSCEACFLNGTCPVFLTRQKDLFCPRCGSINLKKGGKYRRKTKHKNVSSAFLTVPVLCCKDCGRIFVDSKYPRHRLPPEVIDFALSLAQRQTPLRRISEQIKLMFRIEVSHPAIGRWVRKYSPNVKLPKGRPHDAEWRQKISDALRAHYSK